MTLVKEELDRALLTLSSTLRHLSAPHRDATRFSLSSSWLKFCTHSLTVVTQNTNGTWPLYPDRDIKVNGCNIWAWKANLCTFTEVERTCKRPTYVLCFPHTYLYLQYGPNLPVVAVLLWTNPRLSWRLERAKSPWRGGPSTTEKNNMKICNILHSHLPSSLNYLTHNCIYVMFHRVYLTGLQMYKMSLI